MMSQPQNKRQRTAKQGMADEKKDGKEQVMRVIAQFQSSEGEMTGTQLEIPVDVTSAQLQTLINNLLGNDDPRPYSFFLNEEEIKDSLRNTVSSTGTSTETVLPIVYQPQAIFRVRAVTRCTATIPGHTDAVLHVSFSADGQHLASGGGDATVRLWDVNTETPKKTLRGHKHWVLAVAWSPNSRCVASGGKDGEVRVWSADTGKLVRKPFKGHKKWITSLAWEPFHKNPGSTRLASASKDGAIKIWNLKSGTCLMSMTQHTHSITCIKWGGSGLIYSASQDRTIKVWEADTGKLCRTLEGHGHWVNTLSLNTDYAIRTGPYDHKGQCPKDEAEAVAAAQAKYDAVIKTSGSEMLVSGSDDFTLFLWTPEKSKKPVLRMTGHQQPVNYVMFSPDGRYIASASFDKSVRVWNGKTGKFIATFRNHVQAVYQVCWSADSRMLCSSSKDSTLKVWDMRTMKIKFDLPGHSDEVYAVDWSPNGERVCSGGKDKVLKIWRQ